MNPAFYLVNFRRIWGGVATIHSGLADIRLSNTAQPTSSVDPFCGMYLSGVEEAGRSAAPQAHLWDSIYNSV